MESQLYCIVSSFISKIHFNTLGSNYYGKQIAYEEQGMTKNIDFATGLPGNRPS